MPSLVFFFLPRVPSGKGELLTKLLSDAKLTANARAKLGLDDLALLHEYLQVFDVMDNVRGVLARSRARGRARPVSSLSAFGPRSWTL